MISKKNNVVEWNKVYKKGSHWEKGQSENILTFTKYLKKGDKILDIGCGSGRDPAFLAKKGFEVYGIDISKEAIKKAKENFIAENLHFSISNAENIRFEDEFFDKIYSAFVLQFTSLKTTASEIFRVLKKNGVAFLIFLLNTKIVSSGKTTEYYKKEAICLAYKKFKILEEFKFISKDYQAKEPHIHDIFVLVLKK
ncbi:methyltransferase domain-containing protein [Candidatus Woesearchaeota archaeon]|nr:methyltransferase domain-containing protein [Candidatus Woesearchaeota archaeon]